MIKKREIFWWTRQKIAGILWVCQDFLTLSGGKRTGRAAPEALNGTDGRAGAYKDGVKNAKTLYIRPEILYNGRQ
ncbi:MAG: hypothetical protein HFF66_04295 [Oscillospiraceae bacterium]|jgi:hypothetical protein|nr:hypothetical protein [Oscillospiraceae bacterium]